MPLNLSNVSITIPTEVVSHLKQVFLPTDDERQKFAAACDPKAIAQELVENHGNAIVNSIVDTCDKTIASKVAEQLDLDMKEIAENIDISALAQEIDTGEIAGEVAREIDLSDLADRLSNRLDASEIAEHFSDREIAREIDCSDVAAELDAQRVADCLSVSEIAAELDAEEIAAHVEVDDEAVARAFVKWLSTNPDGMSHFVHAFCKAYVEATSVASR